MPSKPPPIAHGSWVKTLDWREQLNWREPLNWREKEGAILIEVRAKPRAAKNAILGVQNGALVIAVRAAPAEGAANAAILETLAAALRCAKSSLELARGHQGREKTIRVFGLSAEEILVRLGQT